MSPKRRVTKERVTEVIDGDTFKTASRKRSVRLADVDAPELEEWGGKAAKLRLEKLILGKDVLIEVVAIGHYGRYIAKVKVGNRSVNNAVSRRKK